MLQHGQSTQRSLMSGELEILLQSIAASHSFMSEHSQTERKTPIFAQANTTLQCDLPFECNVNLAGTLLLSGIAILKDLATVIAFNSQRGDLNGDRELYLTGCSGRTSPAMRGGEHQPTTRGRMINSLP
jgi:hypothetical protein